MCTASFFTFSGWCPLVISLGLTIKPESEISAFSTLRPAVCSPGPLRTGSGERTFCFASWFPFQALVFKKIMTYAFSSFLCEKAWLFASKWCLLQDYHPITNVLNSIWKLKPSNITVYFELGLSSPRRNGCQWISKLEQSRNKNLGSMGV